MSDGPVPRATARVQFNADFGFREAARLAPYLARLGVSHVYASPVTMARPGSTHGYDVVDHGRLDPALGDRRDFEAMATALRREGLAMILDVVPNHTGIGPHNPFWWDVLEWGRRSVHAHWFDIDWEPDASRLRGRILVPVLMDELDVLLDAGGVRLAFDAANGAFRIEGPEGVALPVRPEDTALILAAVRARDRRIARIADGFARLPDKGPGRRDEVAGLRRDLADLVAEDPDAAAAVDAAVACHAPGEGSTMLRDLLDRQHFVLDHHAAASGAINYRRFFNIGDLAGLRVEVPEVFDHVHRLAFDLVAEGIVEGLRIDHVDGLLDPAGYCGRVRAASPRPVWLVVEKIVEEGEELPAGWGIDGTTGYETAALLTGLLLQPDGVDRLADLHVAIEERPEAYETVAREARRQILDDEFRSEFNRLGRAAASLAASDPAMAIQDRAALTCALRAVIACFPVYRTYVDETRISDADRRSIEAAVSDARRVEPEIDPSVFDFIQDLMTTDAKDQGFDPAAVVEFAMRAQQLTGPVMAKGVEDTALYRWCRLLAVNEVGADPRSRGVSVAAFHDAVRRRQAAFPHAMVATSTHDTKRGEDARGRLAGLTVVAEDWVSAVPGWLERLGAVRGAAPGPSETAMMLQMLAGSLPAGFDPADADALSDFRERFGAAVRKAVREAKVHTNWSRPDEAYERAVEDMADRILDPAPDGFLAGFLPVQARIEGIGRRNALVQTALKLTIPGVPDIYQGADLWELSMVDPDNRRPVDYTTRLDLLDEVEGRPVRDFADRVDGAGKLALTARLLGLRRRLPELFSDGTYLPLEVEGDPRIVAFERRHEDASLVVVANRWAGDPPRGRMPLPEGRGGWTDVLSGDPVCDPGGFDLAGLADPFPVAVLLARRNDAGADR